MTLVLVEMVPQFPPVNDPEVDGRGVSTTSRGEGGSGAIRVDPNGGKYLLT